MGRKLKGLILSGVVVCFAGLLAAGMTQTSADDAVPVSFSAADDETAAVGSAENTFKILEIVPNESMGMIGYMIGGCEPIDMELLKQDQWGSGIDAYTTNLVNSGLVTREEVTEYAFAENLPADYAENQASYNGEYYKWWQYQNSQENERNGNGYSEYGYYEKVDAGAGSFSYDTGSGTFSYVGSGNGNYTWTCTAYYTAVGSGNGDYQRVTSGTDEGDLSAWTFSYVGAGAGNYQRTVRSETEGAATGAADTGASDTGEADTGTSDTGDAGDGDDTGDADTGAADTSDADTGDIDDTDGADAGTADDTGDAGDGDDTGDADADDADTGDTVATEPEGIYWTYRTEQYYYYRWYYEYTNNNCLTAAIFGEENKDTVSVEVVTVTPDKLTGDALKLIEQADLITITAQDYMTQVWDAYNLEGITRSEEEKQARATTFRGVNGNDLPWETAVKIVERMASANPPGLWMQQNALYVGGNSGEYNVGKLYVMLMQYGANIFYNTFMDEITAETYTTLDGKEIYGGVYNGITNWDQNTFLTEEYGTSVMHEAYLPSGVTGEVFGTILLFNGDTSFLMGYMSQQIGEFSGSTGSNTEMFDYYEEQTGTRPTSIPMAQGVFYILRYAVDASAQADKEELHILELEPCNAFIYGSSHWQLYYMALFPWFTGNMEEDVTVTTMTTYQFIGDITDLNSEYDLIIIGSSQDASNGASGYNDTGMNTSWNNDGTPRGLIYTSIGDLVTSYNADWTWNWKADGGADEKQGSDAWQIQSRYSGTDITKKKYEELRDFLASGSPIVVDKELYTYSYGSETQTLVADTADVDISSYIYRLISDVYQDGNTDSLVFQSGMADSTKERNRLANALRYESCNLVFSWKPEAYTAETEDKTVTYYYYTEEQVWVETSGPGGRPGQSNGYWTTQTVQKEGTTTVDGVITSENYNTDTDESGNPVLRFTFTVEGNAQSSYGVRLYLDQNGDGIYNDSIKEQKELEAAEKTAGSLNATLASEEVNTDLIWILDMTTGTVVTDGNLLAGHTYQLLYYVRSSERGILPWKLEVYDKANDSIRCSDTGYTAFKVSGDNVEKEQINVLQMNLMPDMQTNATTYVNFADTSTETGAKFRAYLDAVEDFDVNLEFMENTDWYAQFGENGSTAQSMGYTKEMQLVRWKEFLEDYDMLIIGYCDMAAFTDDEIFYEGFMEFVNQGKSVILSHDLVSDASFLYQAAYTTTDYDPAIRTLAGQRRKYYVGATCYYLYSCTELNGTEISLLPPDNFMLWYTADGSNWNQLFRADFTSSVETNIPAAADGYTTADTETWQSGDETYKMDLASEFMDNCVRLLASYSDSSLKKDRILNSSVSYGWSADTTYVEIANRGQITNYPYQIGDTMQVATTHAQNFQLDLEQEDGGDVTVWYNLTDAYDSDVTSGGTDDGMYSSRSGDSRNNYYMYTKGNITYTGLGHADTSLTNDEVKLFVNTMISAYREVPEVPYAKVTDADATEHKGTYTLYVVLTGAEDVEDTITVDYTIVDENDRNITSIRTYYIQYLDTDGNILTEELATASPDGDLLIYNSDTENYRVARNGSYSFEVPCRDVIENGEAVYYLNVTSSYTEGTKVYTTSKSTRVAVYAMPLFALD